MSLCAQKGTIADACRGTGINRQQFNKYLSGRYLPSPENLEKISTYLNVDSAQLFAPATHGNSASNASNQLQKLQNLLDVESRSASLSPGLYWMFVPSLLNKGMVLITGIAIYYEGGHLCMRGLRRRGTPGQVNAHDRPPMLEGVVIQTGRRTSILYNESEGISGWRMFDFDAGDLNNRVYYSGVLGAFLPSGSPASFTGILQLVDRDITRWRTYYRCTGYVTYDHGRVDRRTAQALKFLQDSSQHSLFPPHLPENIIQKLGIH
ncbi:helix-turn-helix domain-containing protein [Aestuariivirga litoralis]|uniref:helix-turn-helix domain-containing protein n=1 Tax=Aestuariivirga litoralis TaxID=2650924 RepID=UPI0018C6715A|nr:helix-turn-helix transcriptional regulator [Aestuariivirga litoralis]